MYAVRCIVVGIQVTYMYLSEIHVTHGSTEQNNDMICIAHMQHPNTHRININYAIRCYLTCILCAMYALKIIMVYTYLHL